MATSPCQSVRGAVCTVFVGCLAAPSRSKEGADCGRRGADYSDVKLDLGKYISARGIRRKSILEEWADL